MKSLAPSLAVLAVIGMVPAFGANIADDFKLKPSAIIQLREQLGASGKNAAGNDYNIYNGAAGGTEATRFSIRRARIGISAKDTTGWEGMIQIRAGEKDYTGSTSEAVTLYYAFIQKTWKSDGYEGTLIGGQYKPFNNESSISSSTNLFPQDRAGAYWTEKRNQGLGYMGTAAEMLRFGVDVQNGSRTGNTSAATSTEANGMFYSARVEFAPTKELMPKKKQESYAGAEGTSLLIGLDYQMDQKQLTQTTLTNGYATDTSSFGPDILVHMDGLSALAEYRMKTTKKSAVDQNTASYDEVKGSMWNVQAGYAIPMDAGFVIEPAVRYGNSNVNKDTDEGTNPYRGEWDASSISGQEFGVGVNFYWNGTKNKTQIAYTDWTGEDSATAGLDKPKAHVFTVQQQISF